VSFWLGLAVGAAGVFAVSVAFGLGAGWWLNRQRPRFRTLDEVQAELDRQAVEDLLREVSRR